MSLFCKHEWENVKEFTVNRICDNQIIGFGRIYICKKCLKKKTIKEMR
jgi:hypothetical protein